MEEVVGSIPTRSTIFQRLTEFPSSSLGAFGRKFTTFLLDFFRFGFFLNSVLTASTDFCEFCRNQTKDVVGNRLTKERLDFVYHFAFPPSHAELLPVRESKKERMAYQSQLEEVFSPDRVRDSDSPLEDTA